MKTEKIEKLLINHILPFVSKPGRYIGNELNIVEKSNQNPSLRIVLAFPEVYEIGMSYIGFEILYHILNRQDHIWAERVYMPWKDMEERMRAFDLPLYSLESFTPLKQFDILGFTLQYELTYTNVLQMLDLADIPVWASERGEGMPLVIGGGPCSSNPEPMSPFFDAFLIGDGEEAFLEICQVYLQSKEAGKSREQILMHLSQIRGLYIPCLYEDSPPAGVGFNGLQPKSPAIPPVIKTRITPILKAEFYPSKPIVPIVEATHDRLALEVMRGCTEGCRYCNAGMIYRPVRERKPGEIVAQSIAGIQNTGYDEVSFLSLSISDYSQLNELMVTEKKSLQGKFVNVSLPSMRLDSFSDDIAKFVSTVRKSGFTFAPEAGSERLRRVINKNISDQDLFESVQIALRNGWKLLKFYFMIGLPTETKEDVESIADLIETVVGISKPFGRVNFTVAISPFSPKAHTPFQWEKQDTRENLLDKVDLLKKRFHKLKQIKLNWRDPDISALECILGRGDRRLATVIYAAWQEGSVLEGWTENFNFKRWERALSKSDFNRETLLGEISEDAPLPWDHIDKGITKKFLKLERRKAYQQQLTRDCKEGDCHACGLQRNGGFRELTECYLKEPGKDLLPDQEREIKLEAMFDSDPNPAATVYFKRFRLRYEKKGYARYISHLNLIRLIERACRKANIPLRYSEGFNPHPKLSFAPALSLGFSSEAEYIDMEIKSEFEDDLVTLLNLNLPQGLVFRDSMVIAGPVTSLQEAIQFAEYEVVLSEANVSETEFKKALQKLLQKEQIIVQRVSKGKVMSLDIRPFIRDLACDFPKVLIKTKTIEHRSVRVSEIMDQILAEQGLKDRPILVHRKKQLLAVNGVELTPFDVL